MITTYDRLATPASPPLHILLAQVGIGTPLATIASMMCRMERFVTMTSFLGIILRSVALLACGIALHWCAGGLSNALAGENASGNAVFIVTPSTKIPLGALNNDHVIVHAAERGTQMEFSSSELFKNCSLLRTSTCDLVRGRGNCYGYHIFESSDGDQLPAKFSGVRLPDENRDKKPPEDVLRGTWVFVKGSGKFADIKGGGNYHGRYISSTQYALEWSGELFRASESSSSSFSKEGR